MFDNLQRINKIDGFLSVEKYISSVDTYLKKCSIIIDIDKGTIKNTRNNDYFSLENDVVTYHDNYISLQYDISKNEVSSINFKKKSDQYHTKNINLYNIPNMVKGILRYMTFYSDLKEYSSLDKKNDINQHIENWQAFYQKIDSKYKEHTASYAVSSLQFIKDLSNHSKENLIFNTFKTLDLTKNVHTKKECLKSILFENENLVISRNSIFLSTKESSRKSHSLKLSFEENFNEVPKLTGFDFSGKKLKDNKLLMNLISEQIDKINDVIIFIKDVDKFLKETNTPLCSLNKETVDLYAVASDRFIDLLKNFDDIEEYDKKINNNKIEKKNVRRFN